ncbi:MAG: tRNA (N6-threonylcarbamoyladenosine(37)-N6)-methyltransferase TrmO, partial [Kangiellaceae bacterium]|nr:tRNA (N6-threonylcarbamoyladenosine(37)-N6)-methyltransferase TrmO [Kangiellaceae bacterium]
TRSTFRPNPLGLSVVKLERIEQHHNGVKLHISGMDLLDGTPVLDIKPYIAYSDCIPNSTNGFAEDKPERTMSVQFSSKAEQVGLSFSHEYPGLILLIEEILSQDPRPAYKKKQQNKQEYAMRLYDFDIKWQVENNRTLVTSIDSI